MLIKFTPMHETFSVPVHIWSFKAHTYLATQSIAIVGRLALADCSKFKILEMFDIGSQPTITESVLELADSVLESADSTADSTADLVKTSLWVLAFSYDMALHTTLQLAIGKEGQKKLYSYP